MELPLRAKCSVDGRCYLRGFYHITLFILLCPSQALAQPAANSAAACTTAIEQRTIRGSSLSGIMEQGDPVVLDLGYYACHEIARGDLVAYELSEGLPPLGKMAKGVPGDRFEVKPDGTSWKLLINNEAVRNAQGQAYKLSAKQAGILGGASEYFNGVIPPDRYLILGNQVYGSKDSTRLGLVMKERIIGKMSQAD